MSRVVSWQQGHYLLGRFGRAPFGPRAPVQCSSPAVGRLASYPLLKFKRPNGARTRKTRKCAFRLDLEQNNFSGSPPAWSEQTRKTRQRGFCPRLAPRNAFGSGPGPARAGPRDDKPRVSLTPPAKKLVGLLKTLRAPTLAEPTGSTPPMAPTLNFPLNPRQHSCSLVGARPFCHV